LDLYVVVQEAVIHRWYLVSSRLREAQRRDDERRATAEDLEYHTVRSARTDAQHAPELVVRPVPLLGRSLTPGFESDLRSKANDAYKKRINRCPCGYQHSSIREFVDCNTPDPRYGRTWFESLPDRFRDQSLVDEMDRLHHELGSGQTPAQAAAARQFMHTQRQRAAAGTLKHRFKIGYRPGVGCGDSLPVQEHPQYTEARNVIQSATICAESAIRDYTAIQSGASRDDTAILQAGNPRPWLQDSPEFAVPTADEPPPSDRHIDPKSVDWSQVTSYISAPNREVRFEETRETPGSASGASRDPRSVRGSSAKSQARQAISPERAGDVQYSDASDFGNNSRNRRFWEQQQDGLRKRDQRPFYSKWNYEKNEWYPKPQRADPADVQFPTRPNAEEPTRTPSRTPSPSPQGRPGEARLRRATLVPRQPQPTTPPQAFEQARGSREPEASGRSQPYTSGPQQHGSDNNWYTANWNAWEEKMKRYGSNAPYDKNWDYRTGEWHHRRY